MVNLKNLVKKSSNKLSNKGCKDNLKIKVPSKKSNINVIFVYILSIIIVVFVGFLVIKFLSGFSNITTSSKINNFYNEFQKNYNEVSGSYNNMITRELSLPSEATQVCFIANTNKCSKPLLKNLDNSANIVILNDNKILSAKKIGSFMIDKENGNTQCYCYNLTDQKKVKITFENDNNKIILFINPKP